MAKPARKISAPVTDIIEHFPEIEQGSDAWIKVRIGIPTSSCFSMVMTDGKDGEASKTRTEYMRRLAGEILTGQPSEGKIVTEAMQRGNSMEPEAREHYARTSIEKIDRVGFIRRRLPSGRFTGCSPDGLIGKRKALEIKTMAPHLLIGLLERGAAGIPAEHRRQVYGTMWIADLEAVDLMIFYRGFPVAPKFTVIRNETVIKEISDAVEVFDWELDKLVKKIRSMGA